MDLLDPLSLTGDLRLLERESERLGGEAGSPLSGDELALALSFSLSLLDVLSRELSDSIAGKAGKNIEICCGCHIWVCFKFGSTLQILINIYGAFCILT